MASRWLTTGARCCSRRILGVKHFMMVSPDPVAVQLASRSCFHNDPMYQHFINAPTRIMDSHKPSLKILWFRKYLRPNRRLPTSSLFSPLNLMPCYQKVNLDTLLSCRHWQTICSCPSLKLLQKNGSCHFDKCECKLTDAGDAFYFLVNDRGERLLAGRQRSDY